jgi:outer membrane protein assembly factor BamD (BamD/ComL family)
MAKDKVLLFPLLVLVCTATLAGCEESNTREVATQDEVDAFYEENKEKLGDSMGEMSAGPRPQL